MSIQVIEQLFESVSSILEEEKKEEIEKGEKFNLFSILKMEFKENDTHSAFLGELLDPNGSHLKGSLFLKLFLDEIGDSTLNSDSVKVILEKSIGPVIINEGFPLKSSGGRIDIYLEDAKQNSISIENKLNAPEQKLQVVRYCNYNKEKNKVYYLTLQGKPPSEFSTHDLISDEDYIEISYAKSIINWLERCYDTLHEDSLILKGSIRQYIILLQKITGNMDDEYKEKLIDSILSNYEIVEKLMLNADEARKKVCMGVFKATFLRIEKELSSSQDLEVIEGNDVDHKYSQIWIKPLKQEDRKLWFVLESFSGKGHLNGNMFIGIFNPAPHDSAYRLHPNKTSISNWIINKRDFSKVNGYSVNLMDAQTIQKIYTDERFKNEFIDHIVKETVTFINQEFPNLKLFLTTGKLPEDHDLVSIG